jgi:PadR family transcriptional regulator PadR
VPTANLGEFELLVLLACLRLGDDEAYAVSIADEIEARTGRHLQRAAVYITLRRLESKGLISTHLGDPRPERGGKARRLVHVERAGRAAVREARRNFQRMWVGLGTRLETP